MQMIVTLSLGQRNVYFIDLYGVKGYILWHSDPKSPKIIVAKMFFFYELLGLD
jgi:hypothetical protein